MAFLAETLERLAEGDAFAAIGLTRRYALWAAHALRSSKPVPLFGVNGEGVTRSSVVLPQMTLGQEVIDTSRALRLSLRAHPMERLRPGMTESLPHCRMPEAWGA